MKISIIILFVTLLFVSCTDEDTFDTDYADFEKLELADDSYWSGADGSGLFTDGNKILYNTYNPDWNTWSGFIYSNKIYYLYYDETAKHAAFPSGGADESENYVVGHQFEKMIIEFIELEEPRDIQITNCTYTALAVKYGYGYAKKFGGRDGSDPDWLKLTITGIGRVEQITGTVDFFLADFRFENDSEDYIVDNWEYVNLKELGIVKRLEFVLTSSDAGTPLYFCLDNLKGRVHH